MGGSDSGLRARSPISRKLIAPAASTGRQFELPALTNLAVAVRRTALHKVTVVPRRLCKSGGTKWVHVCLGKVAVKPQGRSKSRSLNGDACARWCRHSWPANQPCPAGAASAAKRGSQRKAEASRCTSNSPWYTTHRDLFAM